MTSLAFPKMFVADNVTTVSDQSALVQNFSLLLQSKIGEFFGDPEYGSTLVQKLYSFNNIVLENVLKDQIYTLICNYVPQWTVSMDNITITRQRTTLSVSIVIYNNLAQEYDTYDLTVTL